MTDVFTRKKRSEIMSKIRSVDTKPEIKLRTSIWNIGIRYRKHDKTVFGRPDVSIKSKKIAIFMDGCFWHGCKKCRSIPMQNSDFWRAKIEYNKKRRMVVRKKLKKEGWRVMEYWEHEINKNSRVAAQEISKEFKKRPTEISLRP